jgi:hypothetical protein
MFHHVLGDRQQLLGGDHPATPNTRHRLAQVVAKQGCVHEAEQIRQLLADSHPDIRATSRDLEQAIGSQRRTFKDDPGVRSSSPRIPPAK